MVFHVCRMAMLSGRQGDSTPCVTRHPNTSGQGTSASRPVTDLEHGGILFNRSHLCLGDRVRTHDTRYRRAGRGSCMLLMLTWQERQLLREPAPPRPPGERSWFSFQQYGRVNSCKNEHQVLDTMVFGGIHQGDRELEAQRLERNKALKI